MSEYWAIRANIIKAIASNDDEKLKQLAMEHPEVFKNITNQAKNAMKKK